MFIADILQPGPAALTEGVRQLHDILSRVRGRASQSPRRSDRNVEDWMS
jgi:hypothetical protein